MIIGLLSTFGGLAAIAVAADQFVKGSARLAVIMRVSPVIVGALIIGFGTSAPELVVSTIAARNGDLDIAAGNLIGSNVANISLVLAAGTLVMVIPVARDTLRRAAPQSFFSVVLFAVLLQNGLSRREGWFLLLVLTVFIGWIIIGSRRGLAAEIPPPSSSEGDDGEINTKREVVRTLTGLALVVGAASLLVNGAESIAEELELSGGFVGFTLVALGTSAPELVTAMTAARQRETDLLVGNLLGSNLFNSLAVGGAVGVVGPGELIDTTLATRGAPLMVLVAAASWLMMWCGRGINRTQAALLSGAWVVTAVILSSGDSVTAMAGG